MKNYNLIPWLELLNNRLKYLWLTFTSFKNLVLIALIALYWFDGLDSWPFVIFAASVLGLREFKEIVLAWRGNGRD